MVHPNHQKFQIRPTSEMRHAIVDGILLHIGALSEEDIPEIRAVNLHVTQCASLLLGRVLSVHHRRMGGGGCRVAPQAQQIDVAVLQHVNVGSAVRDVAGCATGGSDRPMLVNERTLLVSVTLKTNHITCARRTNLPGQVIRLPDPIGPMLVVAIGAFHQAFVDAMSEGHIELGLLL